MLCVVEPAKLQEVLAVCAKWEVDGTAIGKVTDTRRLRVFDDGDAGRRHAGHRARRRVPGVRPRARRARRRRCTRRRRCCCPPRTRARSLVALLGSSNVASRKWAFEQYDALVGSRTVRRPEQADAAVLMLPDAGERSADRRSTRRDVDGPRRAIAVAIDGNGRRVAADPYRGAVEAVLEC